MAVLIQKNIHPHLKLGVWYIAEAKEELMILAKKIQINLSKLPEVKNENRIRQWLATRLLLHHFFTAVEIIYDDLGKPFLSNGWNISISHSGNYVAIILNEKEPCGIDIEQISPKVERIKHKFLNETDLKNTTTEQDLTIYWSAKEALYKYYGKKEVLFIENLFIEDFYETKNNFTGIIIMSDLNIKLNMSWEKIEDYVLVYSL